MSAYEIPAEMPEVSSAQLHLVNGCSGSEDEDPRLKFILEGQGLARSIAKNYLHGPLSAEDVIQNALVGLTKAARRFDKSFGVEFSTFAHPTIEGEIKRGFRDQGWPIRLPRAVGDNYSNIGKLRVQLEQSLGREPTRDEIAQAAGLEVDDIETYEVLRSVVSMDVPVGSGDGDTFKDFLSGSEKPTEESVIHCAFMETTAEVIGKPPFTYNEKIIIELRYLTDPPVLQSVIAEKLHISQMHVSRLQEKALAKLKDYFETHDWIQD